MTGSVLSKTKNVGPSDNDETVYYKTVYRISSFCPGDPNILLRAPAITLLPMGCSSSKRASWKILVASYTNEIYTLTFEPDLDGGRLYLSGKTTVGFHPSWIASHPDDDSLIFACLEQDVGKVAAIKYDSSGVGKVVAEGRSGGSCPCSVYATKNELFVANYMSGSISTLPISTSPPYISPVPPVTVSFTGSGPNLERQEASHAHQVFLTKDENELLVPDLGGDRVYRLRKDENSCQWEVRSHFQYPRGSGPRHLALHDNQIYTILELSNEIIRHHYSPSSSKPIDILGPPVPTLSDPLPKPNEMLAAEILIPPSNPTFPTTFIYASNRNDPSPKGDTIAIFSESLELVAEVRTGLTHLRGMVFGGPDDKWLIAGGANGGGVKIFERVDQGRNLKLIAALKDVDSPTGFLWLAA